MPRSYHSPLPAATPDRLAYVAALLAETMRPDRPVSMNKHAAALLAGTARREAIAFTTLAAHLSKPANRAAADRRKVVGK